MSRRIFHITALCALCVLGSVKAYAQGAENPNALITAFYGALMEADSAKRHDAFSQLFHDQGTLFAVLQKGDMLSSTKGGPYENFLHGSGSFYAENTMSYDEVERSIDYYVDMASVHSLVYQSIRSNRRVSTVYEQLMWFNLSMVYVNDRWFLLDVSWVNAYDGDRIDNAMEQDTLWIKP
jgi:hypothetical protein